MRGRTAPPRSVEISGAPTDLHRKEAPIKLPPGHTIPIRSNSEIAQLFDQEDLTHGYVSFRTSLHHGYFERSPYAE
jgi:hypothetical protein